MTPQDRLISLIIPTRNQHRLLASLLDSLCRAASAGSEQPRFEVVIVDNRSDDPACLAFFDALDSHALNRHALSLRLLRHDKPFNFSAIVNSAVDASHGELICLLNDDTEVISADWLLQLAALAVLPEVGCVGAKLLYTDKRVQHAGVVIGMDRVAGHAYRLTLPSAQQSLPYFDAIREVSAVTGACLMVRREILLRLGGMDENLPSDFNDVDLCIRVRDAGYQNLWTPHAVLYHHESATRGRFSELSPEQQQIRRAEGRYLREKLGSQLAHDPHWRKRVGLRADASWPRQRRLLQHRYEHVGNQTDWEARLAFERDAGFSRAC